MKTTAYSVKNSRKSMTAIPILFNHQTFWILKTSGENQHRMNNISNPKRKIKTMLTWIIMEQFYKALSCPTWGSNSQPLGDVTVTHLVAPLEKYVFWMVLTKMG